MPYANLDQVIDQMKAAAAAVANQQSTEENTDNSKDAAEEWKSAALRAASTWRLPAEYLHFLQLGPVKVSWPTEEYINLWIYSAAELEEGQWGYAYNPVSQEEITDWPEDYLVIAMDEGDPYCLDQSRGDTMIYSALHGQGEWDFEEAFDDLASFLSSTLEPPRDEEDDDYGYTGSTYCRITLLGEGREKIKTMLFLKKKFNCDLAAAKQHLASLPTVVYNGLDTRADLLEAHLQEIGADYRRETVSQAEFLDQPDPRW